MQLAVPRATKAVMALPDIDVAIAGAGIGGLALATMLARRGARVVIYDQMEKPRPVGSGFVLQPTGLAVLARMGMLDAVEARGARITHMYGKLAKNNRTVLAVSYEKGQHGIAIQRVALFQMLFDAAIAAGVRFETSSRIVDFNSGMRPSLINDAGQSMPAADLVVDAMGSSSPIGSDARQTELRYGALWATVPWPSDGAFHPEHLEQRYRTASRMAGVLPVGTASPDAPPMATFFWSLRNCDVDLWKEKGRRGWVEEVAAMWPQAAHFAEIAEPVHARYRHHTRSPLIGPRTIKIGDAWHATSPQLGQGANMALLDAASLTLALIRQATVEDALSHHLKQRQLHIRLYQALSLVLTPFYQSDSRVLPLLRDIAIAPVTAVPLLRQIVSNPVTGQFLDPTRQIKLEDL